MHESSLMNIPSLSILKGQLALKQAKNRPVSRSQKVTRGRTSKRAISFLEWHTAALLIGELGSILNIFVVPDSGSNEDKQPF